MSDQRRARATEIRTKLFGEPRSPKGPELPIEKEVNALGSDYAFGDIWSRPGLALETRSLLTIGILTALYRSDQLRLHIKGALNLGLTPEQIVEAIVHAGAYAGLPTSANGRLIAHEVFKSEGLIGPR